MVAVAAGVLFSPYGLFIIALLILILLYLKIAFFSFQVLKRNGIKGPTPSFFYGNYQERSKEGILKYVEKLHKEYGSIVGFYLGQSPQISVTDIDLIKLITIKDFDAFINRPKIPDLLRKKRATKNSQRGLLQSRDDSWRVARQALSPTFSSSKIKAMTPLIHNSVKILVEVFKEHADSEKSMEFFKTYGAFTMETIFATAFGRVIDIQKGKSDKLTEAAATIFSGTQEMKKTSAVYIIMILSNFPWLLPVLRYMIQGSARQKSFYVLHDTAIKLIKERRAGTKTGEYKDLLQLMLDAVVEESDGSKRNLSDEEIAGHSITFMLAGYETTANALSYTSYLLALNPHIQEKLQEEIDSYFEENPETSLYQAAQDLDYLDMVLQESLRLYPPVLIFERECAKAHTYKGMTIPKGASVFIASSLLHKDPKYWQDPEKFDPLRFTPEEKAKRPQQCYMPFGAGPRSCIGMRFALLEAKIALIELLKRFTFLRAPDTEVPLETILGVTMAPKNGIYLKVVTRK